MIKASGIRYEEMLPQHMVVVDMDGKMVEGITNLHRMCTAICIFTNTAQMWVAWYHTTRFYATAFAAADKPIPVVLTAIADEFGGPIPCGGFALIGDEAIGKVVVESIGNSPAVLLKNHGVFTIGKNAKAAVKAAVMTE
ncbi:MAG: class II aldolase/adducin family protein [Chloroflexi bacterium]|nr:class II aldolase/adducin family protein [Chloroflexota bacterium]